MSVKTTVAQLPELAGAQHGRPSGILVDERPSRFAKGRDRGRLYVLVEVSGQEAGRDIIANQLAQAVHQAYFEWQGSVTAGLQNAIRVANKLLYDDNRDSLPGERRTAGISCAVLRPFSRDGGGDLYIGQAGPAATFVQHGTEATRFPEVSPWLDGVSAQDLDAVALGERRDLEVDLYHTQVSEGDTFLLIDSAAAIDLDPGDRSAALAGGSLQEGLLDLKRVGADKALQAVAVRLGEPRVEPGPVQVQTGAQAPPPMIPVAAAKSLAEPEAPLPLEAALSAPVETPVSPSPQPASPPISEQISSGIAELKLGERLRDVGVRAAAALGGAWAAFLVLLERLIPGQPSPGEIEEKRTKTVKEAKPKPTKKPKAKAADRAQNPLVRKILIVIAIAIPLIVAAIVVATYGQRGEPQTGEIDALLAEANARWEQALQTADQDTVRTLLTEADDYLAQILGRQPEHAEAADLKKRVVVLLDELNQVRRITWIAELNSYPSGADLVRVVVQGVHVFVMDQNAGKVYHHQLDEPQQSLQTDTQGTVLVNRGDQVGNVLVGDLVDMAWMPTDFKYRKESLVILESGGNLLQYDPATGELIALPVIGSEAWSDPRLIGGHTGRFYLLDPAANQVWRYSPTSDGYTEAPIEWLQSQVDLAGVVDMAVGDSIYLLYADGKIRKLSAGSPDTFDISDWPSPPRNPSAIFTRPPGDTQWLYVADRGNSRIVQSSKEGNFKRQFRLVDSPADGSSQASPLAGVTSLFVDEIGGRAYFVSGQKLYLVVLPD